MTVMLNSEAVDAEVIDQTIDFARTLPAGHPLAVVLQNVVEAVQRGADVAFLASDKELTPNQAAVLLKVSRPHLLKLMDRGLLVYRKVGTNRRIAMADLLDYVDRHERANAHVQELLATREHALRDLKDQAAKITAEDLAELDDLSF